MKTKTIFKKITVWSVVFSTILWSVGFSVFVPVAYAAVTVTTQPTEIITSGQTAKASSANTAIAKFALSKDAAETLSSVTITLVDVGTSGVEGTDIANLKVFKDEGDGSFGAGDLEAGSQTTVNIGSPTTITTAANNTIGATATIFFVTLATSATWSDAAPADSIGVGIAADGIATSANSPTVTALTGSNSLTADTTAPTVSKAERMNPGAVMVTYSEQVSVSTAQNTSNYTFSDGLSVIEAVQEGAVNYRVAASGEIAAASTTLTISASVLDLAGNANATTDAQTISAPVRVKISEVSAEMGAADQEFIELVNDSESATDISGWTIQAGDATLAGWTTIATIPGSTSIGAFGHYLLSTAAYQTASGIVPDASFTAGLALAGGHVRIANGGTEIDKIGWGTADTPEGTAISAHSAGQSLERKAFGSSTATSMASGGADASMGNGWDSNSNSFDFVVQTSPSAQNLAAAAEQPNYQNFGGGGPMIMHMPVNIAPTGSALQIIAQMGDPMTPINNINAELHYMVGDGSAANNVTTDYTTVLGTHQSNGYFKFTIPQTPVDNSTANGLYYYLKVTSDGGTAYMSASPSADSSGSESQVAQNPLTASVADGSGWTKHSIAGNIDDGTDPIEGALIMIEGTGYNTTTDASGNYTLSNVKDGIYNMVIVKTGYYEEWIPDVFLNGVNITGKNKSLFQGTGGGMTGDSEKPFVMWTGPNDGMFGIPPGDANFKVFIGFSKDLNSTTVNNSNIYLTTDGSTPIVSTVAYDNVPGDNAAAGLPPDNYLGLVSPPSGGFVANTTYYLIMTGNVRDSAGNSLQGNSPNGGHVISFTTGSDFSSEENWTTFGTGAMMPPFVMGVTPSDGSMNIVPNAKINITFSDPMDQTSVTTSGNIKLYRVTISNNAESTSLISASVSLDTTQKIATITPSASLAAGKYRVVVSGALKSANGIWMGDPGQNQNTASYEFYKSKFEVGSTAVADNTKPTVLGTWPANSATGIAVNPGPLTAQFSEGMDPASINSNTITLKRGTTKVTGSVSYDMAGQSASFTPSTVLATDTQYTFTISGGAAATSTSVTDAVGNPLNSSSIITFTTDSTSDTSAPSIMFANGDDYGIAITFSEPMNAANVTDTGNWGTSVLNLANYIIKWGDPGTVVGSGTVIDLSAVGSKFEYDSVNNTVLIKNLGLDAGAIAGKDFYVNMTPATVSGAGAADLSGNAIASGVTFQMPIKLSSATNGMLGPMTGGMMGMMGPDMGSMGMMMAGVFPMNAMAGQTTTYFVNIPTSNQIADNYKIVLTFPTGFSVSGAKKDPYSPVNNDINEWNAGTISFSTEAESSGGSNNDGVTIDAASRKITIDLAVSGTAPAADYLHLDLAGIVNSSIPKGPETSGYTVDIKIMDNSGSLKETVTGMPFFINSGGSASLSGSITGIQGADVDGTGDEVKVFLGSPMTGPMEAVASIDTNGAGTYSFSSLPAGQYMIFTDPTITLDSNDYEGLPMPQPVTIADGANTKNIALIKAGTGSVATITVNITGVFGTDDVDVFAGSPNGFRVKTLTDAGTNPNATLYLPDGDWMVGVGPAMPKGPMSGPPPMPDWMPPMPVNVKVSGSGTAVAEASGTANDGTVAFTVSSADMQIIGYVKDDSGNAIADAEVFAYQPMGVGMGAFTKTDTNGKFTLKVAAAGIYSVGTFKPGLPNVPDRTVKVSANSGAVDGNATADIYVDSTLITASNTFNFKIVKSSTTISGKVTNGSNPVSYAPVWAYQQNGTGHADTMTDSSGNYILYVGNGSWVVQAYIPGYGDSESQIVVINGSSETQNLSPDSAVTYYNIEGNVSIDGSVQAYMPIRAVKYDDNGAYTGNEYGSQTDASGNYSISVPPGKYRVDIWTPSYGEVELTVADEVANSPANVVITSASKTGKNISIAALNLNTITLAFTNGTAAQEGFVNIDGVSGGKPTGFHKSIKLSTLGASSTVKLPDGDYMFFMDVPGAGHFEPATNPATVSGDATVTFVLPDSSTEIFTVSGQVTDGTDPIEGAWVWLGNKTTGVHRGVTTDASGNYSLIIKEGTYKMGVEIPGYASQQPTDITVSADAPNTDYALAASSLSISGRIYADADSDNAYDSGEQVANGWVWVEETTTNRISGAPTDADGIFSISVIDGTYKLKGVADGYQEGSFGQTITISGSSSASRNIKLTAANNWTSKLKSKPITPANGGTIDDTGSSGSGVKVVAPPNALGSSSSSGNIKTQEVSTVSKTSSAEPLGGVGKQITATDNSGQAITNLNDEIEIELVYYKADIEDGNLKDYGDLSLLTNSYWDSSVSDWVPLSTTKTAYTKASASDAEWTTVTDYSGFVTALSTDSDTYGDYKVVTKSTVDHLTVFGVTTPSDLDAPTAPANLSQTTGSGTSVVLDWDNNSEADLLEYEIYRSTSAGVTAVDSNQVNTSQIAVSTFTDTTASAWTSYYYTVTAVDDSGNESTVATEVRMCSNKTVSNGTVAASCAITCNSGYTQSGNSCVAAVSGGGGGGSGSGPASAPNYCSSVTYGEWGDCVGGIQTRDIIDRSQAGCLMTLAQNNAKARSCSATSDGSESAETSVDEAETVLSDDSKAEETLTDKAKEYAERLQAILSEASDVFKADINAILGKLGFKRDLAKEDVTVKKYVKNLVKDAAGLPAESQNKITNFVSYGTETTQILGEGERAGVVNSYKAAFGKLPEKENEWADVIKIANGRWPGEINKQTEKNALAAFKKIYLREPDRKNPHDDAAVVVIAYGLRPAKRNLNSEKVAIKTFKAIYGYYPKSASAWDIVRAIAYSGATR